MQLTNERGKVIKTYEYDSFGNEVKPDGKDDNPFRYCGEYYDKETGDVYLRARYYQPGLGRFLTWDTYTGEEDEPLSLHLYTYCVGNLIYYIDPTGHKIKLVKGTDEQRQEYKRAIRYLKTSKTGKKLFNKIKKSKKVIKIKFVNRANKDRYTRKKRIIWWDHRGGGVFINGKTVTSAALALAHEMGHAAQELDGKLNKNRMKAENANLKKYETPIAGQLGEPIRSFYKEISGSRRMNNSTHYITLHQHPYKFWVSYTCHHNAYPVVGTTIGPAK